MITRAKAAPAQSRSTDLDAAISTQAQYGLMYHAHRGARSALYTQAQIEMVISTKCCESDVKKFCYVPPGSAAKFQMHAFAKSLNPSSPSWNALLSTLTWKKDGGECK
jgi:hypothetical protein